MGIRIVKTIEKIISKTGGMLMVGVFIVVLVMIATTVFLVQPDCIQTEQLLGRQSEEI